MKCAFCSMKLIVKSREHSAPKLIHTSMFLFGKACVCWNCNKHSTNTVASTTTKTLLTLTAQQLLMYCFLPGRVGFITVSVPISHWQTPPGSAAFPNISDGCRQGLMENTTGHGSCCNARLTDKMQNLTAQLLLTESEKTEQFVLN